MSAQLMLMSSKEYTEWSKMHWLEVSLTVNGELAEAVADVLARFAYSGVMMEQGVNYTDDEDAGTPTGPITVRAYLEMNDQIEETRQKLEESLYYLVEFSPCPRPPINKSRIKTGWKPGSSITSQSLLGSGLRSSLPGWNHLTRTVSPSRSILAWRLARELIPQRNCAWN
jgi:hypothetical protein